MVNPEQTAGPGATSRTGMGTTRAERLQCARRRAAMCAPRPRFGERSVRRSVRGSCARDRQFRWWQHAAVLALSGYLKLACARSGRARWPVSPGQPCAGRSAEVRDLGPWSTRRGEGMVGPWTTPRRCPPLVVAPSSSSRSRPRCCNARTAVRRSPTTMPTVRPAPRPSTGARRVRRFKRGWRAALHDPAVADADHRLTSPAGPAVRFTTAAHDRSRGGVRVASSAPPAENAMGDDVGLHAQARRSSGSPRSGPSASWTGLIALHQPEAGVSAEVPIGAV